jgi:two-component system sensor histidine kinase/response regulator
MSELQPTILMVDDEESLIDIVSSVLEAEGFTVLTAKSVDKGIEHLNTTTPDLIISDITMPGKNGFDFFAYVRSLPHLQQTPFLFLTAHSDPESILVGKELGSDDYLTKPVDFHLLLSSIRGKLKRKDQLNKAVNFHTEKMKNDIFRLITHEMRTPLTSILGATEMLTDPQSEFSPKELTEYLQMLQNSSKRLNIMVDDFLTVTKIESGEIAREMEVSNSRINPHHIVNRLIADLQYQSSHQKVIFKNTIADATISVFMFAAHIENILRRLMDNAVKFSYPHGVVMVGLQERDAFIFSVSDNGCGIAEDKKPIIFQKFGQIDREKHEQQGSGLGLFIAYHLAKLNGGELSFDSVEGKGSTFYLKVPKPR